MPIGQDGFRGDLHDTVSWLRPGKLIDEASAELANNTNYEVRTVAPATLRRAI